MKIKTMKGLCAASLAAMLVAQNFMPIATVLADSLPEETTVTEETTITESEVIVEVVEPSDETEESNETEVTESEVTEETEITETEATEPTETVVDETEPTEETVTDETEVIEDNSTVDIVYVDNTEDFIDYMSNLPNDNRLTINTDEDLTGSIENVSGVFYEDTYFVSFSENESFEDAITYLDSNNIAYAIDGQVSVCDNGGFIRNSTINPNATTRIAVIDTGSNVANESYSVISDSVSDDNGHGTRMVNYILDRTDDAYVISIKALDASGSGSVSDVCAALELAMDSDVDVILMAVSVRDNGDYEAFKQLIAEAESKGITVIASAGNNNSDASHYLPASVSGVITIGAVDANGYKYPTSNYGSCVNYYIPATSTSEAASTFAGMFIGNNYENLLTNYLTGDNTSTDNNTPDDTETQVIVDGTGEYNSWSLSKPLTEAAIRNAGYGSSDAFRAAILASCASMNGANYAQSGGNGSSGEKVDCITYVNVAYANALGKISNLRQSNGLVYFSGSCSGSPFGLYTTTGATGCTSWLNNHGITGNGVSINTSLHVEPGDLVFFGTYTENTTYTCTIKYRQGTGVGSTGIIYGATKTVTGTGSTKAAAESAAKAKITSGTYGYTIDSNNTTSSTSSNMTWGHAAIFDRTSGGQNYFYQARGSAYVAGSTARNVSVSADSTGYNRWLVIHLPTFKSNIPITLTKDVASGYEDVVAGNPCYSFAGTTYKLYSNEACTGTALATFTFDANGNTSTSYNAAPNTTYYLKETSAGNGYLLDTAVYKITTGADETSAITVTKLSTNASVTINPVNKKYTITMYDVPGVDPMTIQIEKVSDYGPRTNAIPNNATFRLEYYQTVNYTSDMTPTVVYEFTLNGTRQNVSLSYLASLTPTSGSSKDYLSNVYAALNGVGDAGRNFPIGTYRIYEITAPTGFNLNNQVNRTVINTNAGHTKTDATTTTEGSATYLGVIRHTMVGDNMSLTFDDTPIVGYASLKKTVENANDENVEGRYNFQVYNTTDNTLIANGVTLEDGTVEWTYVLADLYSVEGDGSTLLTGTKTTTLELATYNANHEKIVYEYREIIPTNHYYPGSQVEYTYECPTGWTDNSANGYFSKRFTVNEGKPTAKNTVSLTCPNVRQSGSLVINKILTNVNNLTEDQEFYFDIVRVNDDGTTTTLKSNIKVTVPAGRTSNTVEIPNVPVGTYRITERSNNRYIVTYNVREVTVTDNGKHNGVFTFKVTNEPKRFDIDFTKYTILPDGTVVDGKAGDATLAGAVYRVFRDENGNKKYDAGEWYKDYTTDENGQFTTDDGDNVGELIVGYTYYIYEIFAPDGYRLCGEVLDISHKATEQDNRYARYSHRQGDEVMWFQFEIFKLRNIDPETVVPEEGAVFEVYLTSAGSYENARTFERTIITTNEDGKAISCELPYGEYTVHQIGSNYDETNSYVSDFTVDGKVDKKIYSTVKINNLIELMLQIRKVDGTLEGALIPYAGAEFEIYRVNADGSRIKVVEQFGDSLRSVFTTNAEGIIELAYPLAVGNYELVEITAPYGYVVWDKPMKFVVSKAEVDDQITVGETGNERMYGRVIVDAENTPVYGTVVVTKIGEGFASVSHNETSNIYTPVWSEMNLEGATFNVYAAEDIIALDGTVRYEKDELVDTITTGSDGVAETSAPLYLNYDGVGRYYLVEVEAPIGYTLDTTRHSFEVTYKDQNTAIVSASASIFDQHFVPNLEVHKDLLPGTISGTNGEVFDRHEYTQVTFGVYAAADIVAADGTIIPKNALIEIIRCDANGLAVSSVNYPFGSYYVKELTTDNWHYMDETAYGFNYSCPESRTTTNPVVDLGLTSVIRNTPETPSIGTTFTYNNSHVAPMNSTVTLTDTVEYEGLMPNKRYEIEGYIVVVNSDGTTYRLSDETVGVSFVTGNANNKDGTVSGSINVEFEVDTTNLAGKSLVAFETLYHDNAKIAVHMDIHSESQTIVVPNIHTQASVNGAQEFTPGSEIVLVDTITYENLEAGRTYRVSGIVIDKTTGKPLSVGECAADVVATTTFRADASSGTVTVEFRFNGSALKGGQELVVFEEIYDVETGEKMAEHRDINDRGQTVRTKTTPTPTPPPITSTGEKLGMTFYAGSILGGIGLISMAIMFVRRIASKKRIDEE